MGHQVFKWILINPLWSWFKNRVYSYKGKRIKEWKRMFRFMDKYIRIIETWKYQNNHSQNDLFSYLPLVNHCLCPLWIIVKLSSRIMLMAYGLMINFHIFFSSANNNICCSVSIFSLKPIKRSILQASFWWLRLIVKG